jgi:integrase/recombinase XerC
VDLQAGEAHVLGKGSKRRMVPVGSKALAALQALAGRARASAAPLATGQPALFLGRAARASRRRPCGSA